MEKDLLSSPDQWKNHSVLNSLPEVIWRTDFCVNVCHDRRQMAEFTYVSEMRHLIIPTKDCQTQYSSNVQHASKASIGNVYTYDDKNKINIQDVCRQLKHYYPKGSLGWIRRCNVFLLLLLYHKPESMDLVTQWQDIIGLSAADVCKIACKINRLDIFEFYESRLDETYFQRFGFMRSCFFISCMYGSHDIAFYLAKKIDNQTRYVVDPDYRNKIFNEIMGGDLPDSCKYQPLLILLSFDDVYWYVKSNPTLGFQWIAPFNSRCLPKEGYERIIPKEGYERIILESFFSLMVKELHGGINYSLNCRIDCLMFIVERKREEKNRDQLLQLLQLLQEDQRNVLALLDFSDVEEAIKSSPDQFQKVVSAAEEKKWSQVTAWCKRHGSPRCFFRDSSFFSEQKRPITSTNSHDPEDDPVDKEEPGCSLKKPRSI